MTSVSNPDQVNYDLRRFLDSSQVATNVLNYSDADNTCPLNLNDFYFSQLLSYNLKPCLYSDVLNFDDRLNLTKALLMMHINIRSLQKHFDSLLEILQQLPSPNSCNF